MRILSTSAIALIAAAGLSASAMAADIFDAENDPAPEYQAQVNWTGVWLGALGGYQVTNYELKDNGGWGPFSFDGIDSRGFNGCGILGAQKQVGTIVFGLEGRGCGSNASTDLTFGGFNASVELDYSYAAYGKLGFAIEDFLISGLIGYKWQHAQIDVISYDDTVEGFSGGLLVENKLDDAGRWTLGVETLFTQFEEQDAAILNIDPTQYEANFRLTYTIGQ